MKNYLAIDIGASSGRAIIGTVKDGKIALEEVFRFENSQVRLNGHDCWDIDRLVESVKEGIDAAMAKCPIESIGIDTWGVDFVLLDEQGERCCDSVAYRDERTKGADAEIEKEVMSFADVPLFRIPWTVAHQAPLFMGFFQIRILEWVAIPFSKGSSQSRNQTQVSCIAGRFFTS